MSPMLCASVGHSGIFSSHLAFALADPAGVKLLEGLLSGFVEQYWQHHKSVLGPPGAERQYQPSSIPCAENLPASCPCSLWDLGRQSCSTWGR